MNHTHGHAGHAAARAIAIVLSKLRHSPPREISQVAAMSWHQIRSISWAEGLGNPTIVFETMAVRSQTVARPRLIGALDLGHPLRADFDMAIAAFKTAFEGTVYATVNVAYPGWNVGICNETLSNNLWESPESLAVTSSEWNEFIVQRDADSNTSGEYAAGALRRAAALMEKQADALPIGYHQHWTRVDAEVLRRLADQEVPQSPQDIVRSVA